MDFSELPVDGQAFEQLVRELLFNRGMDVYWSGRGPDGGRDLICHETVKGLFGNSKRTWLIQCKHYAGSAKSVGIADLDDIITSCAHHNATGYLLVCSTQPSSSLIQRLEAISNNTANNLTALCWDAITLQRLLSNPKDWSIAQRFLPTSCGEWSIYATEQPNRFIAHYKGYVIQLTNRIGSDSNHQLPSIEVGVRCIEGIKFAEGHFLRPRAVWYDDKNGGFQWYIDYMHPYKEAPQATKVELQYLLGDFVAQADGLIHNWDIKLVQYSAFSDHYDQDHYDYYAKYGSNFLHGEQRECDRDEYFATEQELEKFEASIKQKQSDTFRKLRETFDKVPYLKILNAFNACPEIASKLERRYNWADLLEGSDSCLENLFSARLIIDVSDDNKFHALVAKLPIHVTQSFRLSKVYVYLPDTGLSSSSDEYLYDLWLNIHPALLTNQKTARDEFNNYFEAIMTVLEAELASINSN